MSLIINALKKVEKQKNQIPQPVIPTRVPLRNRYWVDIIAVIIAATIIGTIMSTVFIKVSKLPEKKEQQVETTQEKIKKQPIQKQEKPKLKENTLISNVKKTLSTITHNKKAKQKKESQKPKPTRQPSAQKTFTNPTGFKLSGIMWDAKKPIALINNQFLKENEIINNATVVKIHRSHVIIKIDNQTYILRIT